MRIDFYQIRADHWLARDLDISHQYMGSGKTKTEAKAELLRTIQELQSKAEGK